MYSGLFSACPMIYTELGIFKSIFFSDQTLVGVRKAIASAGVVFVTPAFDMWKNFCNSDVDDFVANYSALFTIFLVERRKAFDAHYIE